MDRKSLLAVAIALVAGLALGFGALRLAQPPRARLVEADFARLGIHGAVLYTDSRCDYCRRAAAWLDARGVRYQRRVIDQSANARREFAKLGQAGVPVLVNERVLVLGFDPGLYRDHFTPPGAGRSPEG